jgi:hypothetical protein
LSDPLEEDEYDSDDWEEEDDEGFFSNIPWIGENFGSLLEAQLCRYREPNQCRQCGKFDEALREKKVEERFCSDECQKEWKAVMDVRIQQGLHDLRTRGYD